MTCALNELRIMCTVENVLIMQSGTLSTFRNPSVNPVGSKKQNPTLVVFYLNRDSFRKGCDCFW